MDVYKSRMEWRCLLTFLFSFMIYVDLTKILGET